MGAAGEQERIPLQTIIKLIQADPSAMESLGAKSITIQGNTIMRETEEGPKPLEVKQTTRIAVKDPNGVPLLVLQIGDPEMRNYEIYP